MKELRLPIPDFQTAQNVAIEVRIGEAKKNYYFRVVSFPWQSGVEKSQNQRIQSLKHAIEQYDKNWELIEIYTPTPNANTIQVLYRQLRASLS